jgi:hypothetical protein
VKTTTKRAVLCFDRGPAPSWRLCTNGKDRITLCWLSHFVCGIYHGKTLSFRCYR